MNDMTPEQLIESVADKLYRQFKPHTSSGHCDYVAKEMLRIVIEATERGEVVCIEYGRYGHEAGEAIGVKLNPEFKELLNK